MIVKYSIIGDGIAQTAIIGGELLKSIKGKKVTVGPFNDDVLSRVYIWMKGESEDVEEVIEDLKAMGIRMQYKVMIGGGPVTREYAKEIGADGYGKDAIDALEEARRLFS